MEGETKELVIGSGGGSKGNVLDEGDELGCDERRRAVVMGPRGELGVNGYNSVLNGVR